MSTQHHHSDTSELQSISHLSNHQEPSVDILRQAFDCQTPNETTTSQNKLKSFDALRSFIQEHGSVRLTETDLDNLEKGIYAPNNNTHQSWAEWHNSTGNTCATYISTLGTFVSLSLLYKSFS
jgi:hypothetical protein